MDQLTSTVLDMENVDVMENVLANVDTEETLANVKFVEETQQPALETENVNAMEPVLANQDGLTQSPKTKSVIAQLNAQITALDMEDVSVVSVNVKLNGQVNLTVDVSMNVKFHVTTTKSVNVTEPALVFQDSMELTVQLDPTVLTSPIVPSVWQPQIAVGVMMLMSVKTFLMPTNVEQTFMKIHEDLFSLMNVLLEDWNPRTLNLKIDHLF